MVGWFVQAGRRRDASVPPLMEGRVNGMVTPGSVVAGPGRLLKSIVFFFCGKKYELLITDQRRQVKVQQKLAPDQDMFEIFLFVEC
jgi:hypothetical protein